MQVSAESNALAHVAAAAPGPNTSPTKSAIVRLRNLHLAPGWQVVTGPSIAPNVPSKCPLLQQGMPWLPNAALVSITGVVGKYSGAMWTKSFALPISPITGLPCTKALLRIRFAIDNAIPVQAIEFGAKPTDALRMTYNANFQLDNSKAPGETMLEIASANGGWSVPFGTPLPQLEANENHQTECAYLWNITTKTASVFEVVIDGSMPYSVPVEMQKVPAQALGWAPSILTLCVQPNINETGGSLNLLIRNMDCDLW
jgi:hypothetical protein